MARYYRLILRRFTWAPDTSVAYKVELLLDFFITFYLVFSISSTARISVSLRNFVSPPLLVESLLFCIPHLVPHRLIAARLKCMAFLSLFDRSACKDTVLDCPYEEDINLINEGAGTRNLLYADAQNIQRSGLSLAADEDWNHLLQHARIWGTAQDSYLHGDVDFDVRFLDIVPELFVLKCMVSWEDIVLFHIGQCTRVELGIKAAFCIPLVQETLWLEATMSSKLKDWLAGIPGVIRQNQQAIIYAISPEESWHALSCTVESPYAPGCWVKVHCGKFTGDIGIMSNVYAWGCRVLFVPHLDLHHRTDGQNVSIDRDSEPKLFNVPLVENVGLHVVQEGQSLYRFCRSIYDHDLVACRLSFSLLQTADEIPERYADLFAKSVHPLAEVSIRGLPKVAEWCFEVGEVVTDVMRGMTGTIDIVGHYGLEVNFIDGQCPVGWAHCRKVFNIGAHIEITKEALFRRWSGWVHAIDNGVLHLICQSGHENQWTETQWVHPNGYHNIVDEESWLPLNEARPASNHIEFIHGLVPTTNILQKIGCRPPSLEPTSQQRSVTPLPDPTEQSLSPAWNPLSSDPPSYWCLDRCLLGTRFRVQYDELKITALVKLGDTDDDVVCIRDDTPHEVTLDPAKVIAIHLRVRHYDMFLVISGEHCGNSDLDWDVVVVIPRALYLPDDVTDERLTLHSSLMTIADKTKVSRQLNLHLRKRLRGGVLTH
ncbi:hypothetical protein EDD18DRAFT_1352803 [Armillaria luteobubalina]|uniref:Uncharacterized protein n=1 Tax=Armillaria luteobubalina TaxID=153913 RepID=A0AA39TPP4_9AGAR|nr:hypothetical protein EDD18DRAFT_1352803 [Armillaria luteobubalina]